MIQQFYEPRVPGLNVQDESANLPPLASALAESDPESIVQSLEKTAHEWYDSHQWIYRECVESTANWYGAQWGYYSDAENRYVTAPEPRTSDQVRVVINILKPITEQGTGILTDEEPIFDASAATSEGRDTATQQAAHAILYHSWRHHRLTSMYRMSAREGLTTGTSFVHVGWDESVGAPYSPIEEGMRHAQGGEQMPSGDLNFTRITAPAVAFDPMARHPHDGEGVFIRERWSRSRLRDRFPGAWEEVESDRALDLDGESDRARDAERFSPVGGQRAREDDAQDVIWVYTLYIRSCQDYPRGRMLMFAGGKILHDGENPVYPKEGEPEGLWPNINWPLFTIRCDERTDSPWGRGRVVDCIDPQRSFNGVVSKSLQHIAKMANAKVMLPKGLDTEWTDEIGQIIPVGRTVNPGQIGYINPAEVPMAYWQAWDRLKAEVEFIFGVSASTNGQVPFADTSGRAMEQAQQRDFGRLAPVKKELDRVWGEIMHYSLRLFRRHANMKRKVMVVGENGVTSLMYFDRASLATEIDIRIQNDQSIPRDPNRKMVWLTQFTQMISGVQDPGLRSILMELTRLKDFEPYLEKMDPDAVKARRMRDRLMLGQLTPAFQGDNPLAFKAELERLMKSEEYENRVAGERAEGGISETEQLAMTYWIYYTNAAAGQLQQSPAGQPPAGQPQNAPMPAAASPSPAANAPVAA